MFIYVSLQLIAELNATTYEKFSRNPVLYYKDQNCKFCVDAIKAWEETLNETEKVLFKVNCDKTPEICKDLPNLSYPIIQARYKTHIYNLSGNSTTSKNKILQFIQKSTSNILYKRFPTLAQCIDEMESKNQNIFFVMYGPDPDDLDELIYNWRNQNIFITYFADEEKKLVCFKNGLTINFRGQFIFEDISLFIAINRYPAFQKYSVELQESASQLMHYILVFDPKIPAQKEQAQQYRQFIIDQQEKQTPLAQNVIFSHSTYQNNLILELKLDVISQENSVVIVKKNNKYKIIHVNQANILYKEEDLHFVDI